MTVRWLGWAALLWTGCHSERASDVGGAPADADTDVDADADADSDSDTDDPGSVPEVPLGAPYTDPLLALHPDIATIVVASWDQSVDADETWFTWQIDGVDQASPHLPVEAGPAEQVILGVPAETAVDLVLHEVVDGVASEWAFGSKTTGSLPNDMVIPTLLAAEPDMRPEPYLLASIDVGPFAFFGPCYTVILDAAGRVVWYRKTSGNRLTWQPRVSRNGGYLLIDASVYYVASGTSTITRTTLDLAQVDEFDLVDLGITYDELDDDSIIFDEAENGYDYHLTRQYPDGTRERVWSCRPWMSAWTDAFWDCAANTVSWLPDRGTALYSMFQTSTVVEVDLATGALVRVFGAYPGAYAFDPPPTAFELQHNPNFTASGNLIVSTHSPDGSEQWGREYAVDDVDHTLHEVWDLPATEYAEYAGQLQRLPSGNLLWELGTAGLIEERTDDGRVVWAVDLANHLTGNITPIADLYAVNTGW